MAHLKVIRPEPVTIELDGKERVIRYDLNAFAELEKRFGTVDAAMTALQTGSFASIKTILWVGLIHEEAVIDPDTGDVISYNINPYQVGSWITPGMLPYVSQQLSLAISDGSPEPKESTELSEDEKAAIVAQLNPKMATIVLTEEDKKKAAEELKNA